MPVRSNPERRTITDQVELRARDGKQLIVGHAAVFNRLSQNLGGFVERVRPGAFTKTLKEADVRALINHDPNQILGRNVAGTLELDQDEKGLVYRVRPGKRSYEIDLLESLERGDVDQSSFGFFALDEDWGMTEQGFPVREIIEASLVDVSVVTYPAYLDADSGLSKRMALSTLEQRSGVALDDMLADPEKIKCAVGEVCKLSEERQQNEPGETHSENEPSDLEKRLQELRAIEDALRGELA